MHPSYVSLGGTLQIEDNEPLELTLSAAQQFEGDFITATVTRKVDDISQAATINISISDRSQLTAPSSFVIPANERSATFKLDLPRDRIRDGNKPVGIEVQSDGFVSASAQVNTLDLESLWHNPRLAVDINDDGVVSPLDALLVINFLNIARGPVSQLVRPGTSPLFLDTNDDGSVSPVDALLVINYLNSRANGEGESTDVPLQPSAVDEAIWQIESLRRRAFLWPSRSATRYPVA